MCLRAVGKKTYTTFENCENNGTIRTLHEREREWVSLCCNQTDGSERKEKTTLTVSLIKMSLLVSCSVRTGTPHYQNIIRSLNSPSR